MSTHFKAVALIGKYNSREIADPLRTLAHFLVNRGHSVMLEQETATSNQLTDLPTATSQEICDHADLAVVVGGDGTMLHMARLFAAYDVPIVGVNLGRLGFMTDIPLHNMLEMLSNILRGEFVPEERALIKAEVRRWGETVFQALALNDVVMSRGAAGRMIEFEIFIDGQFVYSQRSDGLIVSTPTGSTAYALASGGPIIHPTVPTFALVPICPQSMNNRPIAVPDRSRVEFVLTRNAETRAHFDGQAHFDLQENDQVVMTRHDHPLRLLHPVGYNYYDMLRHKLHWGEKLMP